MDLLAKILSQPYNLGDGGAVYHKLKEEWIIGICILPYSFSKERNLHCVLNSELDKVLRYTRERSAESQDVLNIFTDIQTRTVWEETVSIRIV